MLIAATN